LSCRKAKAHPLLPSASRGWRERGPKTQVKENLGQVLGLTFVIPVTLEVEIRRIMV
jgi:hypothetical protein